MTRSRIFGRLRDSELEPRTKVQGPNMMTIMMMMMMMIAKKSIVVSPPDWQASPGAVNLLLVHYNVFLPQSSMMMLILMMNISMMTMLMILIEMVKSKRQLAQDYWRDNMYDRIIWLTNHWQWHLRWCWWYFSHLRTFPIFWFRPDLLTGFVMAIYWIFSVFDAGEIICMMGLSDWLIQGPAPKGNINNNIK